MKKTLYFITVLCALFVTGLRARSQTTLSAGDVAIVGYNADGPIDNFSFILLTNISAGTSIIFTDLGWCTDGTGFQKGNPAGCTGGSGSYGAKTDGAITWTSSTALACGTEVWVQCQNSLSAIPGTVTGLQATVNAPGDYMSLAVGGDHIFAIQGSLASPTFITGMSMNNGPSGAWDPVVNTCDFSSLLSALPAALNASNSFTGFVPEVDNAKYNCTVTSNSPANLRTAIFNSSNWDVDDGTPVALPLNCSFSCNSCIAPSVTGHQPNRTLCVGGSTTLPITATGTGLTYQWQVNTGSGFSNVPNAAPYSNITTSTLTISSVTGGMSGYTYRCVVTGTCGTANSNSSTLTVDVVAGTSAVSPVSCNGGSNGAASITVTSGIGPFSYSWSPSGGTSSTASGLSANTYTCTITDNLTCTGTVQAIITEPSQPVSAAVTTVNNVTCPGGTNGNMTVTPAGGTPGYTYLWNTGATTATIFGLTAGTYTCTVRDSKNCPTTTSAAVSAPPAFVTSSSTTPVSCNGGGNGTATVTVSSGGQPPYTYQWSAAAGSQTTQTATGLSAGTYSVTVRDNNLCPTVVTGIVVGQPSVLNAGTSKNDITCFGYNNGMAAVTPTGGNGGYSYLWTNGATSQIVTGLAPGPISCTITDSKGCTVTKSFTINQPTDFTVGTSQTPILCSGGTGSATVSVSGATAPYSYSWSPSGGTNPTATGLLAGTYTVIIEDFNGCQATRSFTLTAPPALTGTISKTDVSCFGGGNGTATVSITGGTGAYSYSWAPSGGTGATASGLGAGTYTCTITDANNCQITRTATVGQPPVALSGTTTVGNVSCFGGNTGYIDLTPTGGTPGYTYNWGGGVTTQDRTALAPGSYSVTITDANGCTAPVSATVAQPAAALSGTAVVTDATCLGGSTGTINITAAGGTFPYTYDWGGGITTEDRTGLTAGSYSVTITDANGCTTSVSATVGQPAVGVSGTTTIGNVACFGGNTGYIDLTPTGGTPGYTYNWGGGITTQDRILLAAGTYSVTITDANGCTGTVSATVTQPAAAVSGTTVVTNIACFGGTTGAINLTPTGGTFPYTYNWGGGITTEDRTLLTAGSYSVTITDNNGCTGTVSATVSQPAAALSGTTVVTNVSCFGGSNGTINLTPTGGTFPYTYDWGGGVTTEDRTGLAVGSYSVTITDANGCTATVSAGVTQPAAALSIASTSQTDVACNGASTGSASVTVAGGTPSYSYSWSPSGGTGASASGLAAGTYTVTVTDANACQTTQSFTITQPAALVATASAQTNVLCNGAATGSAAVTVTGGTGAYTYSWSPSGGTGATASGLTAGTYTVTVTDANLCQTTQSFTITQPAAFAVSVSQTNVSCNGGSNGSAGVTVTGGTGAYVYTWTPNVSSTSSASGLTAGTYDVLVTDDNLCTVGHSFTITEPAVLAATTSQTNILCNGASTGSATVNVTGGTAPYSYSWSPGGSTTSIISGLAAGTYTVTVTDFKGCITTASATITQPAALQNTPSQTNVLCNGAATGSATASVTGGTGAYTYSWSPSGGTGATASGLTAGTYTVTVTDANLCQLTASYTITQPSALIATAGTQTNVLCNGAATGSATVNVTGGTGAYTYSWSPSGGTGATASGLTAGTYTVTVTDANLCQTTQSFTITQATAFVVTPSQTNVSCNGGSNGTATVVVTGGTGAYNYSWSPSGGTGATASGLAFGTYTVTITDASLCQTTQSFTITQPPALVATAGTQVNVSCNGGTNGSATVNVTGGTGAYTYSWSPSGGTGATASGLGAGTYTVTVTDANTCQTTQSFTITQPNALVATAGTQVNVLCNGAATGSATVNVTGGTGAYTYSWSPSGGTGATASGLTAGTYTVTVKDVNLCQTTQSFTITQPSALVATAGAQTNILCNGAATGSATVNVTGGTGAYTYSWSPSGGTGATASGLTAGTYTVTVKDANLCQTTQSFTITQPAALVATAGTQVNVSCNGGANGSATVNVTGGTGAYTYSWSPSGGTGATASGLASGTYTVTVKDANLCQTTQSFTITQPAALVATAGAQTNVLCNGAATGSASVTVTGGTGAYTYSWSPSGGTGATASGLTAGTYTVTVKDVNLCQTTQSFTITQPSALVATAVTQVNVLCNGAATGSAAVTVTGGTGAYTYSWSPSGGTGATASGLTAGTYTVTVKDANLCQTTQSFTITQPTALVATAGTQVNVSCNGGANGSATVNVTGGTGTYTYSWSPSGGTAATASGLTAGTYTVTVKDANLCETTQVFTITEPALLVASAGAQTDVSCNGGANGSATVNVTGGTGTYTYSWSPSGGTGATASGLIAGTYTVTVQDANLCQTSQSFTIGEFPALSLVPSQTNLTCYESANGTASVAVTGGTGTYTYSWSPAVSNASSLSGMDAGTYTVTVKDANLCTATHTFTITQPAQLVVTSVQTNVTCFGGTNGSVTLTASGGVGSTYDYEWTPGTNTSATLANVGAGSYTYVVTDDNGCEFVGIANVTQPAQLQASVAHTDITCNGADNGSATLTVTGGTGAYTYAWTPGGGSTASISNLEPGLYSYIITDDNDCEITGSVNIIEPSALSLTGSSSNVTCNGANDGTAEVTVTGGTGTYTYDWNPGTGNTASIDDLAPGTYTVTVTDGNDCEATYTATITQPAILAVTASHTNVACNGGINGTATLEVTGGTAPYEYVWTPGGETDSTLDNLVAGTYGYTVTDANGCEVTGSITVTQPAAVVLSTTQENIFCNGDNTGSAEVNVSGGVAPYSYDWTPGTSTDSTADNLVAGTYIVTVTDDNGCLTTATVTITQSAAIASTQSFTLCGGESVTVGGNTYTTSGTYTDVFTAANGCDSTVTTVLTVNVVNIQTSLTGLTITAAATDAGYQWLDCATNTVIAGATSQSFSATVNGSYAVQVTQNGCTDTSACVAISNVGIVENGAPDFEINLYPNPTSEYVYIQTNATIRSVEVLDISGKKHNPAFSVNKLDFTTLPSGVYLVRITAEGGRTAVLRVVRM